MPGKSHGPRRLIGYRQWGHKELDTAERPHLETMVDVMKIKVPPSKDPMHTSLHSLPPTPQQATLDSRLHKRVLDTPSKSGSVSCGVTAPFSWVLVHTSFCLYLPRVYFLVLCKFWQLYGGFNGNLLQEGLCHTQVCCTQSPCPCGRLLLTCTSTGDPQTQSISVSVESLGPGAHKVCLSPLSISGRNGV